MILVISAMICIISLVAPLSVSTDGPEGILAYWKLDEDSGTAVSDSVGTFTGILVGDPTWTNGRVGNALDFDGVDDYVTIPREPSLEGMESFTYEAWIYKRGP